MSGKHCITFVHPSSTLRPHAITSGLFPIPCLTLVYRTGVTGSATLPLSIFHSCSPRLTPRAPPVASDVRTCIRTRRKTLSGREAAEQTRAGCKRALPVEGLDASGSLPFVTTAEERTHKGDGGITGEGVASERWQERKDACASLPPDGTAGIAQV